MLQGASIRTATAFALALLAVPVASADAATYRDPVGESAFYQLDRNPERTSRAILSGAMTAAVTGAVADQGEGATFDIKIDYRFRIRFGGNQDGSNHIAVPTSYFDSSFMQQLRQAGIYESSQFKARHVGYDSVRTLDGGVYENCDKVLFYDIDQAALQNNGLFSLASDLLLEDATSELQDMELLVHFKEGVPVLGAVKLDLSGRQNGVPMKAGADYRRQ